MPALERLAEAQRVEDGAEYDLERLAETGIEVMPDLTVERGGMTHRARGTSRGFIAINTATALGRVCGEMPATA